MDEDIIKKGMEELIKNLSDKEVSYLAIFISSLKKEVAIKIKNKLELLDDFNREPYRVDYSDVMEIIKEFTDN